MRNTKRNIDNLVIEKKNTKARTSNKPTSTKRNREVKNTDSENEITEDKTARKKRKTSTKEGESLVMPLSCRTDVTSLKKTVFIGAHVSSAGGTQNSVNNALHIGCNAFALFLRSQRKWVSPPLAPQSCEEFKKFCLQHNYDTQKHVLPHGSYLVNLAQAEHEKAEQAYNCFVDDLRRCEALGIKLYNFHPGSSGKNPREESIKRIAAQLNKAHKATKTVVTVLENMAGAGNVIGSKWEDLRDIIELVDDKSRVGVCLDTCHAFAAGHDIRSPEAFKKTMDSFSEIVGMSYLKALHLNDSKAPFASNRDVHANIGTGFIGLRAFHNVINFPQFQDLPMILETPIDKNNSKGISIEDKSIWATEIKLLEGLIDIDPETDGFKTEEKRLQDIGAEERKKFQLQNDKKRQKNLVSMLKNPKNPKKLKKTKKIEVDEESEASDSCCSH
ncbi:putative apurinic endonuclease [Erysiphe necator]|uniref:Apurinic-apyrimidinic endonuclease 1 n=1 Tax=Uncinula necator TaxID=52586 RepID=A0A0B1P4C5_UNCNE|nr:putative apurinic endonuclease [Erysiphe necator]